MPFQTIEFHGQPALELGLPRGDRCTLSLQGGQVVSWVTADGIERLYLSPKAVFDGQSAIRAGTPVMWPQFAERGNLPKHGFVRTMTWKPAPDAEQVGAHEAVLVLRDDEASLAMWPHPFRLRLKVTLAPRRLHISLAAFNTGSAPFSFSTALHTYLRVDDIAQVRLEGLFGAKRFDKVRQQREVETSQSLNFDTEFDSVYAAPAAPLHLVQPSGTLEISQSASCTETVVWNPGAELCAKLPDMPDDGYHHMLCVEAARVDENVLLQPGGEWQGWQQLDVR